MASAGKRFGFGPTEYKPVHTLSPSDPIPSTRMLIQDRLVIIRPIPLLASLLPFPSFFTLSVNTNHKLRNTAFISEIDSLQCRTTPSIRPLPRPQRVYQVSGPSSTHPKTDVTRPLGGTARTSHSKRFCNVSSWERSPTSLIPAAPMSFFAFIFSPIGSDSPEAHNSLKRSISRRTHDRVILEQELPQFPSSRLA